MKRGEIMIKEIIAVLLLLGIFTAILISRTKDAKPSYGKLVLAIGIPVLFDFVTLTVLKFAGSNSLLMAFDIIRWVLISVIHMWACCFIYQTITNNVYSVMEIWKHDFRIWNVIACVGILLGVGVTVGENWMIQQQLKIYTQMLSQDSVSFLQVLGGMESFNGLIRILEMIRNVLEVLVIGSMMVPALLYKKPEESME